VLRVPSNFTLTVAAGTKLTCAEAVTALLKHPRRWEVRSAASGSKGERWYAWAWLATAIPASSHLLIAAISRPGSWPFHYCCRARRAVLTKARLIRAAGLQLAGRRRFSRSARTVVGLDQCRGPPSTSRSPRRRHDRPGDGPRWPIICSITAAQDKDRTDTQATAPRRPGQPHPPEPGK
jgi:hypothetical protein